MLAQQILDLLLASWPLFDRCSIISFIFVVIIVSISIWLPFRAPTCTKLALRMVSAFSLFDPCHYISWLHKSWLFQFAFSALCKQLSVAVNLFIFFQLVFCQLIISLIFKCAKRYWIILIFSYRLVPIWTLIRFSGIFLGGIKRFPFSGLRLVCDIRQWTVSLGISRMVMVTERLVLVDIAIFF